MGTLLAFAIVCMGVLILRRMSPTLNDRSEHPACRGADRWNAYLLIPDVGTPAANLDQIVRLAGGWSDDLLHVREIPGRQHP